MTKYVLTTEAQLSLAETKKFSTKKFGAKRTALYLKSLRDRMKYLAKDPKLGTCRTDIFPDWSCYSYFEDSHTIYYEIKPAYIIILDVLHQSMEPERHLLGKEGEE